MRTKTVLIPTIALILCLSLTRGQARSEPTIQAPKSDVWRWQLGSHEMMLSAPQGVRFAAPVYWEDPGSQP